MVLWLTIVPMQRGWVRPPAALGECVTRAPLQTTPEILCRSSVSAQDENSQPWRLEAANVQPVVQPAMPVLIHAVAAHHAIMAGPPRERRVSAHGTQTLLVSGVKLLLFVPRARGARVFVAHGSPYASMTRPYLKYVE